MEESGAMVAKKVWSMVRALYFMLRKEKSNKKMLLTIKMMMKRGKLARKAFHNLMLLHHQPKDTTNVLPGEYIFSCSDTPLFRLKTRNGSGFFSCAHATPTLEDGNEINVNVAVIKALEMIQGEGKASPVSMTQDSPYPVGEVYEEEYCVDDAAEEFIQKFYKDLKKQT